MTASTEWFQLVSVRKPHRKLFSTCPRAYAKQLTQCFVAGQHVATAIGNSIGPFRGCGLSSRLISSLEFYWVYWFYSCLLRRNQELAAGALLLCPKFQSRFLTKVKSFHYYSLKWVANWWQHLQMVLVQNPNRKLFLNAEKLTHFFLGSAVPSNSHRISMGPFRSCGLSSRLISSWEFYWV